MKISNKIITILTIISLLFIAGCNGKDNVTGPEPYIGGSQGLLAEFEPLSVEEEGLYTVYQDETFPIQLILKNKGEENVNAGDVKVELFGILISDFSGIKGSILTNTEGIDKISEINTEGGEVTIDFGPEVEYSQNIAGGFYDANIFASYTYRYKTHISVPQVCFKENLRDNEVCNVDERKTSFSSGAPIQVQSVEENPAGAGTISLDFELENVGGGEVTTPGAEFPLRYGKVAYKITPATEKGKWTCTAAGRADEARLTDNKALIRCKLNDPLAEGTKFTKQIGLEISYDYRDIVKETVRIKKLE